MRNILISSFGRTHPTNWRAGITADLKGLLLCQEKQNLESFYLFLICENQCPI